MDVAGRLPLPGGARGRRATTRPVSATRPGSSVRPGSSARPAASERPAARAATNVLHRERHQADYSILLAVIALAAIGILMVYSSSAMFAYTSRDNTLAIVGPQIFWGALGILVMLVVMRMDYRWLRIVSVPAYLVSIVLLVLVFVPSLGRVVGGSARWLVLGPLPAVHPAEVAKLALIVYLAHWMANKGKAIGGFRSGTIPFFVIAMPVILLVFKEPDLGTTIVITLTAFTMFFVAGASLRLFSALIAGGVAAVSLGLSGALTWLLKDYQLARIQSFLDPWADPLGAGFHTIQGLLALGLGGILGSGLGESKLAGGLYLPNAWNDFIFAIIGEEFGFIGAGLVIGLFVLLAYAGIRTALRAPDTFGALLAAGITAWLCYQAFINIGVVVALLPVTGITLPFISAGGSSLLVSFAAAGVLLSISRETTEPRAKGAKPDKPAKTAKTAKLEARRTDEAADRGGGHRGSIYPALAVASALRHRPEPPEIDWVGGRRGLEDRLVPTAGFRVHRLVLRSLRSVGRDIHLVLDPIRLALSVPQALWWLLRRRPAAIFTTGGYVAIPVLIAGRLLGVPALLWEGNVIPGRSVRATARLASALAVSFEATCAALPSGRPCLVTGTPIRDVTSIDRLAARERLGIPAGGRLVVIFGGSQAVRRLNDAVVQALPRLVVRFHVIHVAGPDGLAEAEAARAALSEARRDHYRPAAFLGEELLDALAAADLVVGRAGSSTLAEAAAFGLPMVVVPYPHAGAHQRANAEVLANAGAAQLIDDAAFDADALLAAVGVLEDPARHAGMAAASRGLGRPGAAGAVAALLLALAERRALPDAAAVTRIAAGAA